MWFGVVTLFPELLQPVLTLGVTGRAIVQGLLQVECWNPRQFTSDLHQTVDYRPYGGGPGMVMKVAPLQAAIGAARAVAPKPPSVVYLSPQGRQRTGVFFVRAQGWDPQRRQLLGAGDERLILVTDLGVLVKRAVDGTEDVFVQSVSSGEPVAGAIVQLLGRNGLALATRTTDEQGRAQLPSFRDARREREPALYLVRKDEDAAFLPVGRSDRVLDLSRFEVGGVSNRQANPSTSHLGFWAPRACSPALNSIWWAISC